MADTIATIPLSMDQSGVLRVGDTRVSLDSVIYAFQDGATPEEIVQQFTTLDLADVYSVIGYYLQNTAEVQEYLQRRTAERPNLEERLRLASIPGAFAIACW